MTIGVGIFITAVGAILHYAVTGELSGIDIQTAGTILMIAGLVIAVAATIATLAQRSRAARVAPAGYRPVVPVDQTADSARI
jgi:nitrogen fixation protein FixH